MSKFVFSRFILFGVLLLIIVLPTHADEPLTNADLPPQVVTMLTEAGNSTSDMTCYQLLQEARQQPDLPPAFAKDLDRMIEMVAYWATGLRNGSDKRGDFYIAFMIRPKYLKVGKPLVSQDTVLGALYDLYAGRGLLAYYVQRFGHFSRHKELREETLVEIYSRLERAYQAFPDNPELALLVGETTIPWPHSYADDPKAPQWANLQRRSLEGLTDVIHWWIDNRQTEEGFFGSGWGDDIEMWRVWMPVFAAFDDTQTNKALEKLSVGLLSQDYMKKGYSSRMVDVEHTSEDTSDVITPMLLIHRNDPEWRERTMKIVDLAEANWMGLNERDQWQHKSVMFNVDRIDPDPRYAADTTYHCRLYQPAMLLWQRENNDRLQEYFLKWIDTWVDASMRNERGKPAGILPTAIRWPDGMVGGLKDPWWNPNVFNGVLYRWPCVVGNRMMCNAMLLAWLKTNDDKYLQPLFAMAEVAMDVPGSVGANMELGSREWMAHEIPRFLTPVLAKYRLISGDARFDQLLTADPSGYMKMRLTGDRNAMHKRLANTADALSHNMELYTTLCRAGDRVFATPSRYFGFSKNLDPLPSPDMELLYAMATGDPDISMYASNAAVRWLTSPREIATLVTAADRHHFTAELYHFGNEPRDMGVELYTLADGPYQWQLVAADSNGKDRVLMDGTFNRNVPVSQLDITLPSRKLCRLHVDRIENNSVSQD